MTQPAPRPRAIPRAALALGLAGLLPFYLGAALPFLGEPLARGFGAKLFCLYAAVILSFLGGVRWGLAMTKKPPPVRTLAWSVAPSLAGWSVALAVIGGVSSGVGAGGAFAVLFLLQYLWDQNAPHDGAPPWYPRLRLILTLGVLLACLIVAAASAVSTKA
jgi:hypothetical protein